MSDVDESAVAVPTSGMRRGPWLSDRLMTVVAGVGLIAVIGFVVSPVLQASYSYAYRPTDASPGFDMLPNPAVAPLALARGIPDELDLTLPCEVDTPASGFASFRPELWRTGDGEVRSALVFPELGDPLRVFVADGVVTITVGSDEVARMPVTTGAGCSVTIGYGRGTWKAASGDAEIEADGPAPAFAEAEFSGPAAVSPVSEVRVVTRELGTSPGGLQLLFVIVAIVALGITAMEISARRSERPPGRGAGGLSAMWRSVGLVDLVVLLVLVVWWLFIPLNIDDGWIAARVGSYPVHGDIAGIFTAHSAPMPFGYWLEWLQHFWLSWSDRALVIRIPAMVVGVATWLGLRSLSRRSEGDSGAIRWVMAGMFLVGFGSWGVTLRAEPVLAGLLVASLALAVRFRAGERGRVVVLWVAVVALAISAHPAGIIVVAPVLASWRSVVAWARPDRAAPYVAASVAALLLASTALLFFVDSNIGAKADSIEAYRSEAHSLTIADEPVRYRFLNDAPYSTPMRRASVAFAFVALAGFGLSSRRRDDPLAVAGWTLLLGLALLTLTPSKWPWHLGGLMGVASFVLARTLARLRRWPSLVVVSALIVASAWAWSDSLGWAVFDLRSREWVAGARDLLPISLASLITWSVIAAVIVGLHLLWRRWTWTAASSLAAVVTIVLVTVTASTLVSDALVTNAWTFGRQNVESLLGDGGCGLGDEVRLPARGSLHVLRRSGEQTSVGADAAADAGGFDDVGGFEPVGYPRTGINRTLPVVGMDSFGSWVEQGGGSADAVVGGRRSEWRVLGPGDDQVVMMVMGGFGPEAPGNAVAVQWGVAVDGQVRAERITEVKGLSGLIADWRLVQFDVPPGIDRVRTLARDGTVGGGAAWVAASAPLAFELELMSRLVSFGEPSDVLVAPPLAPYFPCVGVPRFEAGIVTAPDIIVQTWQTFWETTFAAAVSDRYFRIDVTGDPPFRSETIGAHAGDVDNFVFVSQEYLTGVPSRANGVFAQE